MRQARIGSIAGQSAQPTAPPKLRGLPRTGFGATKVTHAQRTVNFGSAPFAVSEDLYDRLQIGMTGMNGSSFTGHACDLGACRLASKSMVSVDQRLLAAWATVLRS
jgi:hypothetical protein